MTVLIKRYANRKLYNTDTSRYITLKGIAELIAMPRTLLSDLIQKSGDALYGALKRGVGDASEGIGEIQRNMRRAIRTREEEAKHFREAIYDVRAEWDSAIQGAVERVFKALDLPRRTDIDALNRNLERVAEALERLDGGEPADDQRSEP
jgi:hypothetical protein